MTAIRLVCIDVDGTLVAADDTIHPRVWPAIAAVQAAGIVVAVVTGRPAFGSTRAIAERVSLRGLHGFHNGASVVDLATGTTSSLTLPTAVVSTLLRRAANSTRLLELYTDERSVVVAPNVTALAIARDHATMLGVDPETLEVIDPSSTMLSGIVRAQWIVPMAEKADVLAEVVDDAVVVPSTTPLLPTHSFINYTPRGVDKSRAVRAIAAALGIDLDAVMFIGDSHNDLRAMSVVGTPVAMGNADDDIKAVARHVVGSVDEGGVADALAVLLT